MRSRLRTGTRYYRRIAALAFAALLTGVAVESRAYVPQPQPASSVDFGQAGKASKGLLLVLAASKPKFHLGESIAVTLTVKNLGPALSIQRATIDTDYNFSFLTQNDRVLQVKELQNLPSGGRATTGTELATGATWVDQVNLDEYYQLNRPGVYKVVASSPILLQDQTSVYATLTSNPITFRIVL